MPWLEFGLALAIGALVGIERERKKHAGESGSGLRTFVLIAEAGAIAAWLSKETGTPWIFVGAGALVASVVVAGYWIETRAHPEAIGKTTEIAALVVYLLGGAAVQGPPEVAVALAIATSAVLAFKAPLHALVAKIGEEDLRAALKLLVVTFIVLPVLPNRTVDPYGALNPYKLGWLVVLISALSFAGYVASRWLGPKRGLVVTGLAGGLVSSTAVTLGFARTSRERTGARLALPLAGGILLAWLVMVVRIGVLVAVAAPALFARLGLPLAVVGAATAGSAAWFVVRGARVRGVEADVPLQNPFSLAASIRFAALFAAVLFAVAFARAHLPGAGMYALAGFAGFADVDAITLSMADHARGGGDATVAAGAIVVAAAANTLAKCLLVGWFGSPELRSRIWIAGAVVLASAAAAFALA